MVTRLVVLAVMAWISHTVFGWDVFVGEVPDYLHAIGQLMGGEDVDAAADKYWMAVRVKTTVFGIARPAFGDVMLNSTPLAWASAGLTLWLPLAVNTNAT